MNEQIPFRTLTGIRKWIKKLQVSWFQTFTWFFIFAWKWWVKKGDASEVPFSSKVDSFTQTRTVNYLHVCKYHRGTWSFYSFGKISGYLTISYALSFACFVFFKFLMQFVTPFFTNKNHGKMKNAAQQTCGMWEHETLKSELFHLRSSKFSTIFQNPC
jgi:hypothetical protein